MTNKEKIAEREKELEEQVRKKQTKDIESVILLKAGISDDFFCLSGEKPEDYRIILLIGDGKTLEQAERCLRMSAYTEGARMVCNYDIFVNTKHGEPFVRAAGQGIVEKRSYAEKIAEKLENVQELQGGND